MPRRELRNGRQVCDWIASVAVAIRQPANLTLIGSAALLWHAAHQRLDAELPEASMDIDTITDSDEVASLCYECLIGSEFERRHGWHVNLVPDVVLRQFPKGWQERATVEIHAQLTLTVPAPVDILKAKLRRGDPRDKAQSAWARLIGLVREDLETAP
jgi:hypothetical protein